ncbi:tetratricopeptide repeat protein [Rhodocaloribacter litoris]|uniref:tetratricopeptide repeat protein n=1 Tax=Rhodocaloribacter litoris TaxID=2558931 RepID=UPI00142257E9|nr:tetratricopeptide repeat protein [Rhodocaloribacter litoris]QXD14131.1 tetratricopeptide repeat protein [Rhodocaloribacter litoris]
MVTVFRYGLMRLVPAVLGGLLAGVPPAPAQPARPAALDGFASVLDDPRVQALGEAGLDLLYNMKLDEARRTFDRIEALYPAHPIGPFLRGLITWWQILPDLHDTSHDEAFIRQMDEVVRRSDRLLKRNRDDFDAMFFKGAALGFRGRLLSNRGEWLRAARDGKEAMQYVFRIAEHDTANADFIFGKGVYDYFADVVPEKYPVVKPLMLFFPDGDRTRGLRELRRVADEGRFIRTEAAYFLLQIYMIYEPDFAQSLAYVQRLRAWHPDNPFFHTLEGRVHAQWGRWREARRIYAEVLERYRAGQAGYTDALAVQALYYLGRAALNDGDPARAAGYLEELERITAREKRDSYFKTLGTLRLGMAYDALGRRSEALERYRRVRKMKDYAGAHDRARQYQKTPYGG